MNTAQFAKLAASTLVIGASMSVWGPAAVSANTAVASDEAAIIKKAEGFAADAYALLNSAKASRAKAYVKAEKAVALMPENAQYRSLLGKAYVAAGRFASAETSFADALALSPGDGRVALNLALMKIARGENGAALSLIEAHREVIATADYGLALALSGDLVAAITTLQEAARAPDANAKTRQNLGLAYALAGRWIEARVVASQDLSLDLVDVRMGEWAQMASPRAAWDQVAGLLRVTPVADPGQPTRLALVMPANQALAAVTPAPANSVTVVSAAAPIEANAAVAEVAPAPVFETPAPASEPAAAMTAVAYKAPVAYTAPVASNSVSIALEEPKPAPVTVAEAPIIRAETSPLKQAVVPASAPRGGFIPAIQRGVRTGQFVVQLGAFSSMSRAETAWDRASSRVGELRNYDPTSASVKVRGNALHRLSVSGFVTREAASQVCTQVRKAGGQCFVRSVSGDAPMQFVSRGGSTRITARR